MTEDQQKDPAGSHRRLIPSADGRTGLGAEAPPAAEGLAAEGPVVKRSAAESPAAEGPAAGGPDGVSAEREAASPPARRPTLRGPMITPLPRVGGDTSASLSAVDPDGASAPDGEALEIDGVPVGLARSAARAHAFTAGAEAGTDAEIGAEIGADVDADFSDEESQVYLEVELSSPDPDARESHVGTIPRSLTLESLLQLSEAEAEVGEPPGPPVGPGGWRRAASSLQMAPVTGPVTDDAADGGSTGVWDFVQSDESDADVGADERVIAGRYRIADDLGAGGMARIYRVAHLHLGKEFALKIIHEEMSSKPRMRRAFFREAQVASQLDHPNIVKITDFGVDERRGAFIVMEYLRGETLHARVRQEGRLRLALALDVALQVAEALHYMHEHSVIHCDIKSENVFLCRHRGEGRKRPSVKLIDFGLSRTEALGAKLAQSEVAGTPEYMAPEQIRGCAPQPSIDIYSLGILLYEMVVGELPFRGDIREVMRAQLQEPVPSPSERLPEPLDERAEALILKALHKDPPQRHPSMGQLIFEIRTLMDMLGIKHVRRRGAVVRRAPTEAEGPRIAFEHCPCPLFRVGPDTELLAANGAFCDFLREPLERLVGTPLSDTRLGPLYPDVAEDMAMCAAQGGQHQRLLAFKGKGDGRAATVLCWLVPEFDVDGQCASFTGIIVPFQGEPRSKPDESPPD